MMNGGTIAHSELSNDANEVPHQEQPSHNYENAYPWQIIREIRAPLLT